MQGLGLAVTIPRAEVRCASSKPGAVPKRFWERRRQRGRKNMPGESSTKVRAAEYVRMSTDGQQYSIANQQAAIREYAAARGIEIVRTYADEGLSGLRLKNRPGLIRLLSDAEAGPTAYELILVYDVSRWGRFQDTDEGGFYEFMCRRAGIHVEYCAEPFQNNTGTVSSVFKAIKRSMAAEYSREQSARVHRAAVHAVRLGHFSGGSTGYGYRRMLVGPDGKPKWILGKGEYRAIRSDYMVLVPGPPLEVRTVRRIFRLYVQRKYIPQRIADTLNRDGIPNALGRRWRSQTIAAMLRNERYLGNLVYGRSARKLRAATARRMARDQWIRTPNAFPALVSQQVFDAAQRRMKTRAHTHWDEASLLARLREIWQQHGKITLKLIRVEARPDYAVFYRNIGRMRNSYAKIGYTQTWQGRDLAAQNARGDLELKLLSDIARALAEQGHSLEYKRRPRLLKIDKTIVVAVKPLTEERMAVGNNPVWQLNSLAARQAAVTVAVLCDPSNTQIIHYLLLPPSKVGTGNYALRLGGRFPERINRYKAADFAGVIAGIRRRLKRARALNPLEGFRSLAPDGAKGQKFATIHT
jgi:DNA invertase Pin-like site-specific DNA recombinase